MAKRSKPYDQMTTAELAAATREYDRESIVPPGRPATPAERRHFNRVRKMGRPQVGQGVKVVPVSIERGLLAEADAFAKRHHLKRSQLVARGLRLAMTAE